jgi:hypothetical protein
MHGFRVFLIVVFVGTASVTFADPPSSVVGEIERYHHVNYVVVSPNGPRDGGDFGPHTPGTKTSGIQEALDFAKEHVRDVYVCGGGIKTPFQGGVGYALDETLHVPWNQNWRLDGGEYWLSYSGASGDAVVIDSQMNCHIKLGLVVGPRTPDNVIRIYPTTKGPDNLCCVVASTFDLNGVVGAGDVWGKPGCVQRGTGLKLDNSQGGISGNKFLLKEINACDVGVDVMGGCNGNRFDITWSHLTNLAMRIGPGTTECIIHLGCSGDIPGTAGLQLAGHRNLVTMTAHAQEPGKNIVFEPTARDNLVYAINLDNGFTNNASVPTNRLVTSYAVGFGVETPSIPPAGRKLVNGQPYAIEVNIIAPGQVKSWTKTDPNGTAVGFAGGFFAGQSFILDPGDSVTLNYDQPPQWRWKALR